jgi:hypothetical protein
MDEETKKSLEAAFAKSEADEIAEGQRKAEWAKSKEAFQQKFAILAKDSIKPDLRLVADMFLERNYPAGVYENTTVIALQVASKGQGLDSVNKKEFPGLALTFHANYQDEGYIFVTTSGLKGQIDCKLPLFELTKPKLSSLLQDFTTRALETLRN